MSIGGNDSGFATVIGLCVMGGTPSNIDGIDPEAAVIGMLEPRECDENTELAVALDDGGPPAGSPFAISIPGWDEIPAALRGARCHPRSVLREAPGGRADAHHPVRRRAEEHHRFGVLRRPQRDDQGRPVRVHRHGRDRLIDTNLLNGLNDVVNDAVAAANADGQGPSWKAVTSHVAKFMNHGPCAADPGRRQLGRAGEGGQQPAGRTGRPVTGRPRGAQHGARRGEGRRGRVRDKIGAMAIFFFGAGCLAGAGAGLIIGLATNPEQSAVSAGISHPSRNGWKAVGEALFPELDAAFKRTFTPMPPNRTRQFSARENGDIVVRWDRPLLDRDPLRGRGLLGDEPVHPGDPRHKPAGQRGVVHVQDRQGVRRDGTGPGLQLRLLLTVRCGEDHEHKAGRTDGSLRADLHESELSADLPTRWSCSPPTHATPTPRPASR